MWPVPCPKVERIMIDKDKVIQRAAGFMLKRGWKRLTAKRRVGVYPEQGRREQGLLKPNAL